MNESPRGETAFSNQRQPSAFSGQLLGIDELSSINRGKPPIRIW
jgi:hypothetical protein